MAKKEQPAVMSSSGTGDTANMDKAGVNENGADSSATSMPGQGASSTLDGQMQHGTSQTAVAKSDAENAVGLGHFAQERALRVSATRDGYRRAGRGWSRTPEFVPLADFSDEQVQQLVSDPHLAVSAGYLPARDESAE